MPGAFPARDPQPAHAWGVSLAHSAWCPRRSTEAAASFAAPTHQRHQRQRRQARRCVAAAAAKQPRQGGTREKIPVFPLGIVALPAADVPLQIFEARYRVLFSTLMAGAQGVDEGLVNTEKPWCGSRLFGMAFYDNKSQGLASIGTLLEITDHANLEDGRMLVNNVGRQRFKIVDVVEEKPVLICEVEYLKDDEDDGDSAEAHTLATQVAEDFRNVVSLSVKLRDASVPNDIANPRQLSELTPRELSFWVASLFAGNPYQQQALLEEDTTMGRLKAVEELLDGTVKYLAAQATLQSAFKTTGGPDVAPPAGGPD
ncbi:ATP-dependent protease [Micractinium conductrix]|uniref:ATP-dependent protease n=1 Tax=Micractinium conductrix TaxID=554055 RepID=A0A2P6UZT3_9CHLO|nr:ATP-dependent protease [Micractinium conductrix]|eukprot:PSC67358.1 ATP-dependent protease [Micractinium conductrix]